MLYGGRTHYEDCYTDNAEERTDGELDEEEGDRRFDKDHERNGLRDVNELYS